MQTLTYSRRLSYPLTSDLYTTYELSKNKIGWDFVSSLCRLRLTPETLVVDERMVGPDGLEPSTPRLSSACSNQLSYEPREIGRYQIGGTSLGGAGEIRTRDPLLAKQMLYQLSYDPRQVY